MTGFVPLDVYKRQIQTMADVINLAEENDFEELYLSYMDF